MSPAVSAVALLLASACGCGEEGVAPAPAATRRPLPAAPAIAAGLDVTCALAAEGRPFCWGLNLDGQLGDGTGQNRFTPTPVRGLDAAHQLAPGGGHTCALDLDGVVWCWGDNTFGQLGDGTTVSRAEPVRVLALEDAVQLAAGDDFTCAVRRAGTVACWGRGMDGRLGDGLNRDSRTPVTVAGLREIEAVDLGSGHACARASDGQLSCWGADQRGQVGARDDAPRSHARPVPVEDLARVTAFSLGGDSTCAIAAGAVHCWGEARPGALVDGRFGADAPDAHHPVALALEGAVEVGVGALFACARREAGQVLCWGDDGYGNLGGQARGDRADPQEVLHLDDATALAIGAHHACAERRSGAIACWGRSGDGQLGVLEAPEPERALDRVPSREGLTGEAPPIPLFVPDGAPPPVTPRVSVAASHACAVRADGHVLCWGANPGGQLGDGTTRDALEGPVEVVGLIDAVGVAVATTRSCAVRANGAVACWGAVGPVGDHLEHVRTSRPIPLPDVEDARAIAISLGEICVLRAGGRVACVESRRMVDVAGPEGGALESVVEIAAGTSHVCARLAVPEAGAPPPQTSNVRCWGANGFGQLGDGSDAPASRTPVVVRGIVGATQIALGSYHGCALSEGNVWCWGQGRDGALGDGRSGDGVIARAPSRVPELTGALEIAAGSASTHARGEDGALYSWGLNDRDQCGLGEPARAPAIVRPTRLEDVTALTAAGPVRQLACGGSACLVLHADGALSGWGASAAFGRPLPGASVGAHATPALLSHVSLTR